MLQGYTLHCIEVLHTHIELKLHDLLDFRKGTFAKLLLLHQLIVYSASKLTQYLKNANAPLRDLGIGISREVFLCFLNFLFQIADN